MRVSTEKLHISTEKRLSVTEQRQYSTEKFDFHGITTHLYGEGDIETAAFKLTQDMERITAWCCINSLLVNPKKTKLLLLGTSQMLKKLSGTDFHITVLGEKIIPLQTV
ncbi:Hypothetical predicted protein [Paramuricea clavata]|uniref:Uncharacterized protein n=1 Tax=Paramuricea clavata TaxID=317549 RepID=A0A6S7FTE8_PARCT|nr:Hypothetical predicted protein [Paramuricea clavata]